MVVTLDGTLTYKKHYDSTKMKVEARNNIMRKLVSTINKVGCQAKDTENYSSSIVLLNN